ncbi:MAG: subclass B3 metallo-beta-lactamase [Acidobacteria bacterium]|nr:subclass B3 metallo-beta-lactamase [Acidobacteriota bacterium]
MLLSSVSVTAQKNSFTNSNPSWVQPFPPFKIAGNLYYVGSQDLAAYLIVTPQGNILINSNLESSPPQIKKAIESLGFKYSDTKILLISHGHFDHCAGSEQIKRETGAKYEVMQQDVPVVESGGRNDFHYSHDKSMWFPQTKVDRVLHDGDTVSLGGVTLTAHLTAGHTKGTTTWTFKYKEFGPSGVEGAEGTHTLNVVIIGSPNVNPGYKLVGNKTYPAIAADYKHQFEVLSKLPCDIFLGAHGGYFDLQQKYERFKNGDKNAFIDPAGYKAYIADRRQAFEFELKKQSDAKR